MAELRFDTYYRYEELTRFLEAWGTDYPELFRLTSIGKSYEGRDIWLATLTNVNSGADKEKPAYWVDANIHATELAPSSAALYLIYKVLTSYGSDERITYLLDSRVLYVVPRLNPDGAEWALADRPRYIRSSTRPYPREDRLDGLHSEDIDHDGRILQMRVADAHGMWKPHPEEPRLLVRREPDDLPGGEYYRLYSEGAIENYDGVIIEVPPPLTGLDLNRNFPVNWLPKESGAGPYPTSEPEIRSVVAFITDHANITGAMTFHTFSGVNLRPLSSHADDEMPTKDLRVYKSIGKKGEEITGYPALSVYHDFKYDPKDYIKGTFDDWLYEHLGVFAWTCEIWSMQKRAGIEMEHYIEWFDEHPVEDDLKLIRWADENLGPEGYVDWYPFDHPQLGRVELGGWNAFKTWRNPPEHLLEEEIAPLAEFVIYNALISPKLELHSCNLEKSGDLYHIRLVLQNTGWLPTHVSEQALAMKVVRGLEVEIKIPDNATLMTGKKRTISGQLGGRSHISAVSFWGGEATEERVKFEWVVKAPTGGEVEIEAVHQRAGTVRVKKTLN